MLIILQYDNFDIKIRTKDFFKNSLSHLNTISEHHGVELESVVILREVQDHEIPISIV